MPPRHHRTVDRVVAILELVARARQGLTLATISEELGAPRTSVHELTNGLLATGYLVERHQRLYLGAGPFVLTLTANRSAAISLSHEILAEISEKLGLSVMAGIGVGDALVYIDHVGDNPALEFVARNHSRRSLYATASGKIILADMPPRMMDSFLLNAPVRERDAVEGFLTELPSIRRDRLAYNLGATLPGIAAVATPLIGRDGSLIASISVPVSKDRRAEIREIGEQLRSIVSTVTV